MLVCDWLCLFVISCACLCLFLIGCACFWLVVLVCDWLCLFVIGCACLWLVVLVCDWLCLFVLVCDWLSLFVIGFGVSLLFKQFECTRDWYFIIVSSLRPIGRPTVVYWVRSWNKVFIIVIIICITFLLVFVSSLLDQGFSHFFGVLISNVA